MSTSTRTLSTVMIAALVVAPACHVESDAEIESRAENGRVAPVSYPDYESENTCPGTELHALGSAGNCQKQAGDVLRHYGHEDAQEAGGDVHLKWWYEPFDIPSEPPPGFPPNPPSVADLLAKAQASPPNFFPLYERLTAWAKGKARTPHEIKTKIKTRNLSWDATLKIEDYFDCKPNAGYVPKECNFAFDCPGGGIACAPAKCQSEGAMVPADLCSNITTMHEPQNNSNESVVWFKVSATVKDGAATKSIPNICGKDGLAMMFVGGLLDEETTTTSPLYLETKINGLTPGSDAKVIFACKAGTAARCAYVWGYKPWESMTSEGKTYNADVVAELHSSCTRATSHCTHAGNHISVFDNRGFNRVYPHDHPNDFLVESVSSYENHIEMLCHQRDGKPDKCKTANSIPNGTCKRYKRERETNPLPQGATIYGYVDHLLESDAINEPNSDRFFVNEWNNAPEQGEKMHPPAGLSNAVPLLGIASFADHQDKERDYTIAHDAPVLGSTLEWNYFVSNRIAVDVHQHSFVHVKVDNANANFTCIDLVASGVVMKKGQQPIEKRARDVVVCTYISESSPVTFQVRTGKGLTLPNRRISVIYTPPTLDHFPWEQGGGYTLPAKDPNEPKLGNFPLEQVRAFCSKKELERSHCCDGSSSWKSTGGSGWDKDCVATYMTEHPPAPPGGAGVRSADLVSEATATNVRIAIDQIAYGGPGAASGHRVLDVFDLSPLYRWPVIDAVESSLSPAMGGHRYVGMSPDGQLVVRVGSGAGRLLAQDRFGKTLFEHLGDYSAVAVTATRVFALRENGGLESFDHGGNLIAVGHDLWGLDLVVDEANGIIWTVGAGFRVGDLETLELLANPFDVRFPGIAVSVDALGDGSAVVAIVGGAPGVYRIERFSPELQPLYVSMGTPASVREDRSTGDIWIAHSNGLAVVDGWSGSVREIGDVGNMWSISPHPDGGKVWAVGGDGNGVAGLWDRQGNRLDALPVGSNGQKFIWASRAERLGPACGDGLLEEARGEVCDDGNNLDGDGCDGSCVSDETCGNGVLDLDELCDDGNNQDEDGCSADCSSRCETVEGFETPWPGAGWAFRGYDDEIGTRDSAIVHDGAFSLRDQDWYYNGNVSVGNPGDKLSWWVFPSGGRAYLSFDSHGNGARSFVLAPNTGDIRFQDNPGFDFVELNTSPQSFASRWYHAEVEFLGDGRVIGRLYDTDGETLLNSVEQTFSDADLSGGIAMRSFDGNRVDTIQICQSRPERRELVEDFETPWPSADWGFRGGGGVGTRDSVTVHDGAFSLRDMGWYYNGNVSVGNPGDKLGWWVYTAGGRAYLSFDSDGSGARSFILARDTGDIRFQDNPSFSFVELNRSPQSFASQWYYAEVEFLGGGRVIGRLFDDDGETLLNSVEQTFNDTDLSGGIAIRSYAGDQVDTIQIYR